MEEHSKALADLTAAIAAMTAKIDDIHPVVQGWKPAIERSVEELRAEVGDTRARRSRWHRHHRIHRRGLSRRYRFFHKLRRRYFTSRHHIPFG